jgi:hypothetical protein
MQRMDERPTSGKPPGHRIDQAGRLRSRPQDAFENLEREIQKEKAEALGRAGERLERALRELGERAAAIRALEAEQGEAWDDADPRGQVGAAIAEFDRFRRRAVEYYQHLIIQREAVGFRRHADVERLYRLPDPWPGPGARGGRP